MLDPILFALKILLVLLLYLFIWRVAWSAGRDLAVSSRSATASGVGVPPPPPAAVPIDATERPRRREAGDRAAPAQLRPRLIVEDGPTLAAGTELPVAGWLTVGRAPTSDLVLDDPVVSSAHARLVTRGQAVVVEDLGSTNGTFVNEKRVAEAQLWPGARLRVGETVFRYEE